MEEDSPEGVWAWCMFGGRELDRTPVLFRKRHLHVIVIKLRQVEWLPYDGACSGQKFPMIFEKCSWMMASFSLCDVAMVPPLHNAYMKVLHLMELILAWKKVVLMSPTFNHVIRDHWGFYARSIAASPSSRTFSSFRMSASAGACKSCAIFKT